MNDDERDLRRGRRPWQWAAPVVAALLLAGCQFASGAVDTAFALEREGLRDSRIDVSSGVVTVGYATDALADQRRAQADRAAQIVWEKLPVRIDAIVVQPEVDGTVTGSRRYPRGLLEESFGPRPAGLDEGTSEIGRTARWVGVIAIVGVLALLVVGLVVILLVVRAARRRSPPAAPPQWGPPPPGGQPAGWQQPPQGWGPPPQGSGPSPAPGWQQPQSGWQQPQWPQPAQPPPAQPPPSGQPQPAPAQWPQPPAQQPPAQPGQWPRPQEPPAQQPAEPGPPSEPPPPS